MDVHWEFANGPDDCNIVASCAGYDVELSFSDDDLVSAEAADALRCVAGDDDDLYCELYHAHRTDSVRKKLREHFARLLIRVQLH